MHSPSKAEGPAIAPTMSEPFDFEQLAGRLDHTVILDLQSQQVTFIARRCGLRADHARIVASLAFGEVRA